MIELHAINFRLVLSRCVYPLHNGLNAAEVDFIADALADKHKLRSRLTVYGDEYGRMKLSNLPFATIVFDEKFYNVDNGKYIFTKAQNPCQ